MPVQLTANDLSKIVVGVCCCLLLWADRWPIAGQAVTMAPQVLPIQAVQVRKTVACMCVTWRGGSRAC